MGLFNKHRGKPGAGASGDYNPKHAGVPADKKTRSNWLGRMNTYDSATKYTKATAKPAPVDKKPNY